MELIYKDKLLEAIDDCDYCDHCRLSGCLCVCDNYTNEEAIVNLIKDATAVDAVEVVRCKDCKYWADARVLLALVGSTGDLGCCKRSNWMIGANGYCSHGERKEVQDE